MEELNEMNQEPIQNPRPQDDQAEQRQESLREMLDLSFFTQKIDQFSKESAKLLIGQQDLLELMLICVFSNGHILLEGVPGIAKTMGSKVLAQGLDTEFSRIQFTPDLMPSDILGTSLFNMKESTFDFKKGPIFSNIVLIDEINRAPAKTQSALFEVMEERQITFDGVKYPMSFPYLVVATQNPIEQEGTYRLPEAQLDRFLMKIVMAYPSEREELEILRRFKNEVGKTDFSIIKPSLTVEDIKQIQDLQKQIHVEDQLMEYVVKLIHETRSHAKIYIGASPRASLGIMKASKVAAMMQGRDYVTPDDIKFVAPHILNHRILLTADAEIEGLDSFMVIDEILKSVEIPR